MHQKENNRTFLGLAVCGVAIAGAAFAFAGPIDPPAGPVVATSPSLADIEALIQSQPGNNSNGPWKVRVIDSRDGSSSQNSSISIAGGKPVILHSINAYRVAAYAFDGPGQLSGSGTITSGNVVGQVTQTLSPSQFECDEKDPCPGLISDTVINESNQATFDVFCPNGLEIAWTYDSTAAYFIHVYYQD